MTKLLLCFFTTIGFSQYALADNESVLTEVDQYLEQPSLESSFHHGEIGTFKSRSCVGQTRCDEFNFTLVVQVINPDTVQIVSQLGDPFESRETITRSQWELNRGNRLRIQLANIESYGYMTELNSPTQSPCSYEIKGKKIQDKCLSVDIKLTNKMGMNGSLKIQINKNVGGLGQIISKSQKIMGLDETFFLKLD